MFKNLINLKNKIDNLFQNTSKTLKNKTNTYYNVKYSTTVQRNIIILNLYYNLKYIVDISSNHIPSSYKEFHLFYILNNLSSKDNVILLYPTKGTITSISKLHKSANWLEREIFDLFGVIFTGHINLRRILTDYGFKGFPLRKDFPVFGYKEICYDFELRQITYVNIKLTQNWRNYNFQRQWKTSNLDY